MHSVFLSLYPLSLSLSSISILYLCPLSLSTLYLQTILGTVGPKVCQAKCVCVFVYKKLVLTAETCAPLAAASC